MAKTQKISNDLPVILFESQKDWRKWLGKNHAKSPGLWLKFAKKGSSVQSVSYAEALEEALCYGWIDGQKDKFDELFWLQKFSRRGPKSIWSKINREKAQVLIDSGRMHASGLAAVELAKQDGRWNAAYDSQGASTVPDDFQAELDKTQKRKRFSRLLRATTDMPFSSVFKPQRNQRLAKKR